MDERVERKRFERWARDWFGFGISDQREPGGGYGTIEPDAAWAAWCARARRDGQAGDGPGVDRMRTVLKHAETVMMIVEPRSHKAEYLAVLDEVRAAVSADGGTDAKA